MFVIDVYNYQKKNLNTSSIICFMDNTMLIQITNQKAIRLLQELEESHMIKVLKQNIAPAKTKISDKYKGVFSKEDAKSFKEHTQTMRGEWDSI